MRIRLIEIELFSYCNRKCKWCPNSIIDRQSVNLELPDDILETLMQDLQKMHYEGVFSFSRYNEPFAYFELLNKKLEIIKKYFPNNKMVSNTNGDFITEEVLSEMLIDELSIMDYDDKTKEEILEKMKFLNIQNIKDYGHYFVGDYQNKKVLYYCSWNIVNTPSDRGGTLSEYSSKKRKASCMEPTYFLGINYDGTVSPCCNVRNDVARHKLYILGDLYEESIKEILASEQYKKFVLDCKLGRFQRRSPCYYCNNSGGRYTKEEGGILYG